MSAQKHRCHRQPHLLLADTKKLFPVNAGIPVEQTLEQASDLLFCLENLIVSHCAISGAAKRIALQYLAEMSRAIIDALPTARP